MASFLIKCEPEEVPAMLAELQMWVDMEGVQ